METVSASGLPRGYGSSRADHVKIPFALTDSSVLTARPPSFSTGDAAAIAAEHFGLTGVATALGSERDQTFLIDGTDDAGVLKVSNAGEDANVLDLETAAILHALAVDPELPIARARKPYRISVDGHFVRLFDRAVGHNGGPELADDAVFDYAATQARLHLALRGFFHLAGGRELLWDLKQAAGLRPLLDAVAEASRRRLVETVLSRFEERVAPV